MAVVPGCAAAAEKGMNLAWAVEANGMLERTWRLSCIG